MLILANTFDTASMPALSEALPKQETVVPKKAKVLPQAGKCSAVQQFLESDWGLGHLHVHPVEFYCVSRARDPCSFWLSLCTAAHLCFVLVSSACPKP